MYVRSVAVQLEWKVEPFKISGNPKNVSKGTFFQEFAVFVFGPFSIANI